MSIGRRLKPLCGTDSGYRPRTSVEPSFASTLKFFARLSKELSKRFGALEGGPGLVVGALEPASEGGKGPSMFFAVASEEKSRTSESWGTFAKSGR